MRKRGISTTRRKKGMSATLMFFQNHLKHEIRFRFSMTVAMVRTRIIHFYAKITKWRLFKKKFF